MNIFVGKDVLCGARSVMKSNEFQGRGALVTTFHVCGRAAHKFNRDKAHRCGNASPKYDDQIWKKEILFS